MRFKRGQLKDIEDKMNFDIYQLIDTEIFYRYDAIMGIVIEEDLRDWLIDIHNRRLIRITYVAKSFMPNADLIADTFEEISFDDYGNHGLSTDWALTKEELL